MAWCPKCKYEYREGIKICADCKIPLVEELTDEIIRANADMEEPENIAYEEEQITFNMDEEELDEEAIEQIRKERSIHTYQNKKNKAEDFKSSAYTLLLVGIVGIVALVLMELHIIPVYLAAPGKYITYGVMGALFLIFIIAGIRSFASAKKYAVEAKSEDALTDQINKWCKDTLTKELIQQNTVVANDLPDEMKYFKYFATLKTLISREFGDLDPSYLESLAEEIYSDLFD